MSVNGINFGNSYPINNSGVKLGAKQAEEKQETKTNTAPAETKTVDAKEYGKYSEYLAMVNSYGITGREKGAEFNPDYYEAIVDKYNTPSQQQRIEAAMGELDGFSNAATETFKELGFGAERSNTLGMFAATRNVNNAQVAIQE